MKIIYTLIPFLFLFFSCSQKDHESVDYEINEIENNLTTAIQIEGESTRKYSLSERMIHYNVPGVSIAVIKGGKIHWAKGYGVVSTINNKEMGVTENTLFQAGSISKPLAALSVLKLFEEDILELDTNVNAYLDGWKVPENQFTKDKKVTLKRLLSHTSGLTGHGFPGYKRNQSLPNLIQVLNGEGNTAAINLDTVPCSIWRYSGGGYTLMEKIVEDVSGLSFEEIMYKKVLQPMEMTNSTYQQPLPMELESSASAAYNRKGEIIDGFWHNYPEKAAAGLWTTPTDLAKYCIEIQQILAGKENGLLSKETVELMLTKDLNNWGLGPSLRWDADSLIFQHGGKNEGFTNEMIAFAHRGDGVIIMTNADNGRPLINEILQSISAYYEWGIKEPEVIASYQSDQEQLKSLIGKYKYNEEGGPVPDINGELVVEVVLENDKLKMIDSNGYLNSVLSQTGELTFKAMDGGEEIVYLKNEKPTSYSFLFYDYFQFDKIE